MIDLETLIGRVWELEGKYDLLLRTHQELVHAYEVLKEQHEELLRDWYVKDSFIAAAFDVHPNLDLDIENENRNRHRDDAGSQEDSHRQDH